LLTKLLQPEEEYPQSPGLGLFDITEFWALPARRSCWTRFSTGSDRLTA
jgi:hypothetical protein